ncbi:hypothetical protein [Sorangium sp. So ce1000]|uniref:hypothetical protein n=1 Tax=Sorangium sp. So ce1000 TaxID=3133325 RepID=UPI003F620008
MPRISDATLRAQIPTALLIGGDQALLQRCQAAAMDVGIIVKACPVSMAAALAEERRPVAIVVTSSTYALAPEVFEDIARDVVSTLVRVDEAMMEDDLGAMLATASRESRKQRSRQLTPGRYSMMPADEAAPVPRSERWTIGVMKADPASRRDPEATPLPRSGPRSAGSQELAYRERVAAAVAPQRSERGGAGAPAEATHRPREAPVPRSERLGVMVGPPSSRARREMPGPTPLPPSSAGASYARREMPGPTPLPPSSAGASYARGDAPAPLTARGGAHTRRDTPAPASQAAGAYARRDTPVAGSPPVGVYARRDTPVAGSPPVGVYARRDTPVAGSQPVGAYARRQAQPAATYSRQDTPAPLSQRAGAYARREAQPPPALQRQENPAPVSQPAAASSWREPPEPAAHPREENIGPQPGAAPPPREALAKGAQNGEAHDDRCAPPSSHRAPQSSHCAPPSSRRAQFHVDIALLFDERGLPRAEK